MDAATKYYLYKNTFYSAYNSNGKNIELAISQVALYHNVTVEHVKTILKNLLNYLSSNKNYC